MMTDQMVDGHTGGQASANHHGAPAGHRHGPNHHGNGKHQSSGQHQSSNQHGNPPSKAAAKRRRSKAQKAKRLDIWRPVPPLEDPEPIVPSDDPATLIRSLGPPPLQGQGAVSEHYLAAVVERAAGLATALAATGGLLAEADDGD